MREIYFYHIFYIKIKKKFMGELFCTRTKILYDEYHDYMNCSTSFGGSYTKTIWTAYVLSFCIVRVPATHSSLWFAYIVDTVVLNLKYAVAV